MADLTLSPSLITVDVPEEVLVFAKEHGTQMMDEAELIHLAASLTLSPWTGKEVIVEIGTYIGARLHFWHDLWAYWGEKDARY